MHVTSSTVAITTDASGDGSGKTELLNGRLLGIFYTKDSYDNGVTFAVTTGVTGQSVWAEAAVNSSKKVYPRVATHSTAGAASTVWFDSIPMVNETLNIVVSAGGNAKSGSFTVLVEGH